jgi:Transposase DDE domain
LSRAVARCEATSLVGKLAVETLVSHHTKEVTMAQSTASAPRAPFVSIRDQLARRKGLPFLALLSRSSVAVACRAVGHQWRERVYTPWITLSLFLSQILSEDHSCDEAVDRLQKVRYDHGLPPVSPETTSYCDARTRLPEGVFWELVRRTGRTIHDQADPSWLFHGRPVKIIDGSTVIMPDTQRNQEAYPQPSSQRPGLGFPIARLLVVFSLAVGTVLEAAMGRYQGKQTSELALLRMVIDQFRPGDIVLADRFFGSYWVIAALLARGVDVVVRRHRRRRADFRCGDRLGRGDHAVLWRKPEEVPEGMSRAEYEAMPPWLAIRELRVHVQDKTKRVRRLVIATTLTDARTYRTKELGGLFRQRWHAELDLRSLKTVMHMDMLRTKSPEMVREEVATHLPAYNLIRGIMAEAARCEGIQPRRLSFKGTLHTVREFEAAHLDDPERIERDLPRLVSLIGRKRVGDRPDRYEPRAVKRRPKPYPLLRMPRRKAKALIKRGIILYEKAK